MCLVFPETVGGGSSSVIVNVCVVMAPRNAPPVGLLSVKLNVREGSSFVLFVSGTGVAFASIIACRRFPAPELATVLTVNVAAFVAAAFRKKIESRKTNDFK